MLGNITLGQFFPGDSLIHRMDPRAKLVLTIALIVAVFVAKGFLSYAVVFAFILMTAMISQISLKLIIRAIRPILFIVALTFVLNMFFSSGGNVIFQWAFMTITDQGLQMASYMAIRLVLLVMGTQLLTLTTSPIALTDGIESLLRPLSKIGFPAHELAMMMSIALRFIPTLMEEADKIMKAQMARGADFESGNLIQRAKSMVPLLVPLFVSAFRRADELALAMEARCYRGGEHRTRMKVLHFTQIDLGAAICLALLIAVVVLLPM
ncbi:energy-coupling factor transporter transmembrane protein EcfT [Eubacteriales bacterium OttesenSCG-928-N13]|nr:energy-coupling factor transporter transmembrane protein EcfT [Eubacteriales bacterium OttesenSCG-928-N13]